MTTIPPASSASRTTRRASGSSSATITRSGSIRSGTVGFLRHVPHVSLPPWFHDPDGAFDAHRTAPTSRASPDEARAAGADSFAILTSPAGLREGVLYPGARERWIKPTPNPGGGPSDSASLTRPHRRATEDRHDGEPGGPLGAGPDDDQPGSTTRSREADARRGRDRGERRPRAQDAAVDHPRALGAAARGDRRRVGRAPRRRADPRERLRPAQAGRRPPPRRANRATGASRSSPSTATSPRSSATRRPASRR